MINILVRLEYGDELGNPHFNEYSRWYLYTNGSLLSLTCKVIQCRSKMKTIGEDESGKALGMVMRHITPTPLYYY